MVSLLVITLICGVLQLALAVHVRNTLIDAASEGARYGALADNVPADGALRTAELIRAALGSDYANSITAVMDGANVRVDVTARVPLFGLFGFDRGVQVSGHALRESFD